MKKFFFWVGVFVAGCFCGGLVSRTTVWIERFFMGAEDRAFSQMGSYQHIQNGVIVNIQEKHSGVHIVFVRTQTGYVRGAIATGVLSIGEKVTLHSTTVRFSEATDPVTVLVVRPYQPTRFQHSPSF